MQRRDDGSVVLTDEEAVMLAKILQHGRELCVQMDAERQRQSNVEHKLLTALDFLEDLGVSSEELTGKLDRRPKVD